MRLSTNGGAVAAALLLAIGSTAPAAPPQPRRFFSDTSFWNQPLPERPEVDPRNEHYVSLLKKEPTGGFGINLHKWTIPVYEVDATTPRRVVAKHVLDAKEHEIWQSDRESSRAPCSATAWCSWTTRTAAPCTARGARGSSLGPGARTASKAMKQHRVVAL